MTKKFKVWKSDQWSLKLESFDREGQSLWNMTRQVKRIPTPSHLLVTPEGLALSEFGKLKLLRSVWSPCFS